MSITERRQQLSKSKPVKTPKPKLTQHQMPKGFAPKESHYDLAKVLGVDLERAFPKFCDYHLAKGNKFKNWDFALNTWIRNDAEWKGRANGNEKYAQRAAAEKEHL
jgi:squalene cyclase